MKAHIARNQNAGIPLALGWNLSAADRGILEGMAPAFGMKLQLVSPADAGRTVAQLLGEVEVKTTRTLVLEPGAYPPALVLANFKDKDVDTLLDLMKQAQVNIPLKAVVTPTSKSWVFGDLLAHLQEEHRLYRRKGDRQSMMTKRIFSALLAAALSLSLLAGCGSTSGSTASSAADGPQRYSTVFYDVFDTVTQIIAYCDNEEEFTAQMDALHADLVEYNQLYDIYNDYDGVTNIKTINDNAGTAPVTVDDKILGMLELAQTMYDTTGGKLNIALGSVLNIWHNYREAALADDNDSNNQLPTQEELDAAAQHCDIANLIIDEDAKTVYLADPAMSLDVGSVGKGYAVEQAAQAAEARGLTSALISVGGNLRAIGTKPDGSQWVGGVENPWNSSEVYTNGSSTVAAVKMSDLSLVTSGDYQRYYVVDGVRYHHLIDPATLWPAAYFDGVSVLAPDSGAADCLTTGLFCLPLEEGRQLVESLDGVEALWCTTDGEVITSSGWSEHTN